MLRKNFRASFVYENYFVTNNKANYSTSLIVFIHTHTHTLRHTHTHAGD